MSIQKIVDDALAKRASVPVKKDAWCRSRYVVIKDKVSEKRVVIDTFEKRLYLLKLRIFAWAEVMKRYTATHPFRMVMITLSYAKSEDYRAGHIRDYMKKIKQMLGEKLYGFAWVSELQKRGAMHYHLILVVAKGTHVPMPDKSGMWKFGMSRRETARTPFYLVSYTGKEHQKDLSRYPKGARLYTASVRVPEAEYRQLYKRLAGLEKSQSLEKTAIDWVYKSEGWSHAGEGGWSYVGSAHTKDYANTL